jgi:hypothetical protein
MLRPTVTAWEQLPRHRCSLVAWSTDLEQIAHFCDLLRVDVIALQRMNKREFKKAQKRQGAPG